jgi:hypothetical protein
MSSPLLVFVLMVGSGAITNNTASCSYYFITDFIYSFAVVGVRADSRKPGNHQQHSILFLLFYNRFYLLIRRCWCLLVVGDCQRRICSHTNTNNGRLLQKHKAGCVFALPGNEDCR